MKNKLKLFIMFLLVGFIFTSCSSININSINKHNQIDNQSSEITVSEMASFLKTKKEHYPLSDEFVERYQQTSGGYLDNAKKAGIEVNKLKHSPNQKWHFFDSWYYPSLEEGTLSTDDSAKSRIYSKLICPELVLWIYEASGVELSKIIEAKNVAEIGKINGTSTTTIASQMRSKVSWDDIEPNVIKFLNDSVDPFPVSVIENNDVTITGLESEYKIGSNVEFNVTVNNKDKVIDKVLMNNELVNINENGKYSFIMPGEEVVIEVILKDVIKATSVTLSVSSLELTVGNKNKLISALPLPSDTTDIASWSVIEGEELISITSNGNNVYVNAISEGLAKVQVAYNENVSAICEVIINEKLNSQEISSSYDISYDLGTGKRAKEIKTSEDLLNMFVFNSGDEKVIDSINSYSKLYGGANGGSGENAWVASNILKFGTTSVNGSLILNLNTSINRVIISGYVYASTCKIAIGDSSSSDFEGGTSAIKATTVTLQDMTVANLESTSNNQVSSITIDFEETSTLRIDTLNSKPLFMTGIEFCYVENE